MNKGDLINAVADAAGISKAQAGDAVDAVFTGIENRQRRFNFVSG